MLFKLFLAQKSQNNLAFVCQFEIGDITQTVCMWRDEPEDDESSKIWEGRISIYWMVSAV